MADLPQHGKKIGAIFRRSLLQNGVAISTNCGRWSGFRYPCRAGTGLFKPMSILGLDIMPLIAQPRAARANVLFVRYIILSRGRKDRPSEKNVNVVDEMNIL